MNWDKSLKQVRQLFRGGVNVVPLVREVPADLLTPVAAYLRLRKGREKAFLLESVAGGEVIGRYSFLGTAPFERIEVRAGEAVVHRSGCKPRPLPGNPFHAVGAYLARYKIAREAELPRFCGGAVGYMGYDMIRHLEPAVVLDPAPLEACFMLFSNIVVFDRLRHRVFLVANVIQEEGRPLPAAYAQAMESLDRMETRLHTPSRAEKENFFPLSHTRKAGKAPRPVGGEERYKAGVKTIKEHIRAGDIFQGVLSERFEVKVKAAPFQVYRSLRMVNPSPYMFFVDMGKECLLGASPEMLVRVEEGLVETHPIAGTRPRGRTPEEDLRNEKNMKASVKERAEHIMLVDLGRNDVGRVARPGTVEVTSFMHVERYSHVMHMVSRVTGRIRRGLSSWDGLASCFPAGTVTGAPKIRAMQILADLEPVPRGTYAGSLVYADFGGNLDSAIAIRSIRMEEKENRWIAHIQAGAGIVADSNPLREWKEVQAKARAMVEAVRMAEEAS